MMQRNFNPFPALETDRLVLRQLALSDTAAIFFLRSDPTVLTFIGREPAASLSEAEEFIERINKATEDNESILWGIALKENPAKLIGTICYWRLQPTNYRAEIGYALMPDYWRKGLMKEAVNKVIEYGYSEMKLHSIEARITPGNNGSEAVLKATGFIQEGYLKEEFCFRDKFYDSIIFSRLQ